MILFMYLGCNGSNRSTPSCECLPGFYDNGSSDDCVSLPYTPTGCATINTHFEVLSV